MLTPVPATPMITGSRTNASCSLKKEIKQTISRAIQYSQFILNSENNTLYPEISRRNNCHYKLYKSPKKLKCTDRPKLQCSLNAALFIPLIFAQLILETQFHIRNTTKTYLKRENPF